MSTTGRTADLYAQLDAAVERIPTTSAHLRLFLLVAAGSLFNVIEQYNARYGAPFSRTQWNLSATAVSALSTATFLTMAFVSLACGGRSYLPRSAGIAWGDRSRVGGEIGLEYTVVYEVVKAEGLPGDRDRAVFGLHLVVCLGRNMSATWGMWKIETMQGVADRTEWAGTCAGEFRPATV
ncbi:hypothetical protein [Mycobacterium sp. NPDC050441]|uniref:hypothetical protein n=1 Tax=Mycobacterium sp. NPDC050441 TaxID=3155403 RepID=UPI0033FA437D